MKISKKFQDDYNPEFFVEVVEQDDWRFSDVEYEEKQPDDCIWLKSTGGSGYYLPDGTEIFYLAQRDGNERIFGKHTDDDADYMVVCSQIEELENNDLDTGYLNHFLYKVDDALKSFIENYGKPNADLNAAINDIFGVNIYPEKKPCHNVQYFTYEQVKNALWDSSDMAEHWGMTADNNRVMRITQDQFRLSGCVYEQDRKTAYGVDFDIRYGSDFEIMFAINSEKLYK